jgi:Ca2+-binding RTX toxin-like protein
VGDAGHDPGTITVNVESDEGLFTPTVYFDLLEADVTSIDGSNIYLHAYGEAEGEGGTYDRYYRVTITDLDYEGSVQGDTVVLTGGTLTEIALFSDDQFESLIAHATGYNISAVTLQGAIDKYDDEGDASDYYALFESFAYIMNGGDGTDLLIGGDYDDTLNGSDSVDLLAGLGGDDTLDGGAGEDIMDGGEGNDTLTGGVDNDMFVFNVSSNVSAGHDIITDFTQGEDTIAIFSAEGDIDFGDLSITTDGRDTLIAFGDENTIRLRDAQPTLSANDFLFNPGTY